MKKILFTAALAPFLPLTSQAATTVWGDDFDSSTVAGIPDDGADPPTLDTWFRIGGASSSGINDTSPGSYTDANHLYLGFRYHNTNTRIVLSDTWDSALDYTLTLDVDTGSVQENSNLPGIYLSFGDGTTRVATGTVLAGTNFGVSTTGLTLNVSGADIATAGAHGQNIYISIFKPGTLSPNRSAQYYLDDFLLTSVPEPSSAVLLGFASLGVMLRRRR